MLCLVAVTVSGQAADSSDDARLQAYFRQNDLHPQRTTTGLYFIIHRAGRGVEIRKRQSVTLNYSSRLLDGTLFDSNTDPKFGHLAPLKVHAGMGEVVAGFDEGLRQLKMGSKATLFIPSQLGYGAKPGDPTIPANAILIFDVEILDVR